MFCPFNDLGESFVRLINTLAVVYVFTLQSKQGTELKPATLWSLLHETVANILRAEGLRAARSGLPRVCQSSTEGNAIDLETDSKRRDC